MTLGGLTSGQTFKLVCLIVYGFIVAAATLGAAYRNAHVAHTRTTRHILPGQIVQPSDIRSRDFYDIAGKHTLHDIGAGKLITSDDVVSELPLDATNTLSVTLMAARDRSERGEVQLCADGKPVGKPAKPIVLTCDAEQCRVIVPISGWPKDLAVPTDKTAYSLADYGLCNASGGEKK